MNIMSSINERTFIYYEIKDYIRDNIDFLFFGKGEDERANFFKDLFKDVQEKFIVIDYDIENESFSINGDKGGNIKQDFRYYLNQIVNNKKKIFVDITAMPIPLIFNIVKVLKEISCDCALFAYTKPIDYQQISETSSEKFELTKNFVGIKPLPGFLNSGDTDKESLLVLFLGYEGNRATFIYEEVSPNKNSTFPIIGFPGYRAGWHYYAYETNINLLYEDDIYDFVEYAAAESPFDAYNVLKSLKQKYPDKNMIISPIGTKPHALGVALYATGDEDAIVIYDNPIEKTNRSIKTDMGLVYDVTCLMGI